MTLGYVFLLFSIKMRNCWFLMVGTQAWAPVPDAGCFSTRMVPTTSLLASRPLPFIWKVLHTSKTDSLHRPPYTPACVPCLTIKNRLSPPGHIAHAPAPHRLSLAWKLSSPHLDPAFSLCGRGPGTLPPQHTEALDTCWSPLQKGGWRRKWTAFWSHYKVALRGLRFGLVWILSYWW